MENLVREHGGYILIAILAVALAFTFGYESGSQAAPSKTIYVQETLNDTPQQQVVQTVITTPLEKISMLLAGIDQEKKGRTATLEVERRNGTGRIFLNFDEKQPLIGNETQTSIKNAVHVAQNFNPATQDALSESDLFYSFKANTMEVEGGSAGAAMALATIALLQGKKLDKTIAITGTVNAAGEIGKVGGILEKAKALKTKGVKTFLVPEGEAIQETTIVNDIEKCTEETIGVATYKSCKLERNIQTIFVNVSNETELNVIEIASVMNAFEKMVEK